MSTTRIVTASLFTFTLLACGASSSDSASSAGSAVGEAVGAVTCAAEAGDHATSKTIQTGAGASVRLGVEDGFPTGSGCAGPGISIDYVDTHGFFGHAGRIALTLSVHRHGGGKDATQTVDHANVNLILFGDPAVNKDDYGGIWCGLDEGDKVDAVELAFSDSAGKKWDSNQSANYVVRFTDHGFDATLKSGVGAQANIELLPNFPSGAGACEGATGFVIAYTDKAGYFGGANEVQALVKTHGHRGPQATSTSATIVLGASPPAASDDAGGRQFTGVMCTIGDGVLDSVELAFSDDAKKKWDSNESKNYPVRCAY